jgi:hypothetical protein
MTKQKQRAARKNRSYLVATFANFPGVEMPLLSDEECQARGINKPAIPFFDHLTPEERLKKLSPLIDLLVEAVIRDIRDGKLGPEDDA